MSGLYQPLKRRVELRQEGLDRQAIDGAEVFGISRQDRQAEYQRDSCDQSIPQLHGMRKRIVIDQLHGTFG